MRGQERCNVSRSVRAFRFQVTILEEALACRQGASARQCLIVSQADDDIAAGSIHTAIMAYTGPSAHAAGSAG